MKSAVRSGKCEVRFPGRLLRALAILHAACCLSAAAATKAVIPTNAAVPAALHDIQGPIIIPTLLLWLIRIGLVAVLGGLLWLGWWWWQKRRAKVAHPPTVPPDRRARERLRQALALMDQPERFCTAVSEITRT